MQAWGNSAISDSIAATAALARHPQIHEGDVRSAFPEESNGFRPAVGVAYNLHIGLKRQQARQPFTNEMMTVRDQYPNFLSCFQFDLCPLHRSLCP